MSETTAFFERDGEAFVATESTRGPWDPALQHGGPPAGLLARALDRRAAGAGMQVVRLTIEILRPLPIDRFTVEETVLRPGKKITLAGASLRRAGPAAGAGEELMRATALCIRAAELDLPAVPPRVSALADTPASPPPPDRCPPFVFPFFVAETGYQTAMEARLAAGAFGQGAMALWMRMRIPLIAGETPAPLVRVVVAADSGNGVSVGLDTARWTFVNPDLTVYLRRPPAGEWVCLDAVTDPEPHGIGLAECRLHDERGPIGRSLQSLIIQPR